MFNEFKEFQKKGLKETGISKYLALQDRQQKNIQTIRYYD